MNTTNFFTVNKDRWVVQRTLYKIKNGDIYNHDYEIIISSPTYSSEIIMNNKVNEALKLELLTNNASSNNKRNIIVDHMQKQYNTKKIKKILTQDNKEYNFVLYSNSSKYISLINEIGQLTIFEKIWFVNTNLRLSISLIQKNNKYLFTSFTSEIKLNS